MAFFLLRLLYKLLMPKRIALIFHSVAVIAGMLLSLNARSVTLEWMPSSEASQSGRLSHYKVCYATIDFTVPATTNRTPVIPLTLEVPIELTRADVPDLVPGLTYYFAVIAVTVDNIESDYSNIASFTMPSAEDQIDPSTQMDLVGMFPRLWLITTNGQPLIEVSGAVGATYAIQSTTNPSIAGSWETLTNLALITPALTADASPQTILENAFIPSVEIFEDPAAVDGAHRFYRLYMPFGYEIAANRALSLRDIYSRLIAVRLPGVGANIVCYVPSEGSYLDYNEKNHFVKRESSGPTIREIADRVASRAGLNWNSASEFTVTEGGFKLLFATVFRNDDPSTDPPLGVPRASSSDVIIDF